MGWGTDRFFQAFAKHGLVDSAWVLPRGSSVPYPISAEYRKPDIEVLGEVISSDHMIEFECFRYSVSQGDRVFVKGCVFRVAKPLMKKGNGDFAWAELEHVFTPAADFNPQSDSWERI